MFTNTRQEYINKHHNLELNFVLVAFLSGIYTILAQFHFVLCPVRQIGPKI